MSGNVIFDLMWLATIFCWAMFFYHSVKLNKLKREYKKYEERNITRNSKKNYGSVYYALIGGEGHIYVLDEKETLDRGRKWAFWRQGEFFEGIDTAAFGVHNNCNDAIESATDRDYTKLYQFTSEDQMNLWIKQHG